MGTEVRSKSLLIHALPLLGTLLQKLLKTQPVVIHDLSQQPEMKGLDLPLRLPAAGPVGRAVNQMVRHRHYLRQTHKPVDGRRRRLN